MSNPATVMIVDDDELMRMLLEDALGDAYRVVAVDGGDACLAACVQARPDLILLDVDMPDMDGYETCRRIRANDSAAPPVIFVSGRDCLQDRLQGYDAGGEDYILKPIEPEELATKVALRLKAVEDKAQMRLMIDYASSTAMTAMSSMGEMGILLQALQRFNDCSSLNALAEAVLKALVDYSLSGLVRLRTPQGVAMFSTQGAVSPIELSIIEQVAAMGRLVEYRSRMSISYEHVTLLISNAPQDDDERRGRLRDHLAVLTEGAEVRALAIHRDNVVERAVLHASRALNRIDQSQREVRVATSLALQGMSDRLEHAYVSVALSDSQERYMARIVECGIENVRRAFLPETDVQQQLTAIVNELKSVVRC
ncbi:MAG TPA: response regulator [Rhodocyclaceae bacterium]|nr:response regulator [Rhodocyclaceae bacterium]